MTLVILPGLDGTGLLLKPFVAALGSGFAITVVSYPVAEPLGYPELEALARAALPEEGPFVILGESFSGPIAVSLAADGSPRLKGVVLCCSFVRNPRPALAWLKPLLRITPLARAPLAALAWLLLGKSSSRALRAAFSQSLAMVSAAALRARLRAVLEVDVSKRLAALNVPVLYLRAARDRVVPLASSELISRLNPRTRIIEMEAPHFLLQSAPAEAAKAVREFVREVQEV